MTSNEQFERWMAGREDEHIEFKEAKNSFSFEDTVKYCVAFANERGGKLVLGVSNKHPRRVVGSRAFENPQKVQADLLEQLRLRIDIEELPHRDGRVIIFHVPSRPIGMPIQYKGAYWMRTGESLVPMTPDQLKRITDEAQPDFSAEICGRVTLKDLDLAAIQRFRELWHRKSGNEELLHISDEQLLLDSGLLTNEGITYAALVLLGTQYALDRHLAQAEIVFEYRSNEASIPFQQRIEYRLAFFLFFDDIWKTINLRNDLQHFQYGPFIFDIPTFNEQVVREALLNAVSHRDYHLAGSVFVRQFPTTLEIISPGGLPEGITPENILDRQYPRNRLIADNLVRCGLVERSGQGFDKIVAQSIREAKPLPDFAGTDAYQVYLTLHGVVRDPNFLRFLEKVSRETQISFSVRDLLILDIIHNNQKMPEYLASRLPALLDAGIIEVSKRGRETQYIPAKKFYVLARKKGVYTRLIGLDREQNKALILRHLEHHGSGTLEEFQQVLPALTQNQVRVLLQRLKETGDIVFEGRGPRYGSWKRANK
jgi:ATP-dependent DNA helicase RecG